MFLKSLIILLILQQITDISIDNFPIHLQAVIEEITLFLVVKNSLLILSNKILRLLFDKLLIRNLLIKLIVLFVKFSLHIFILEQIKKYIISFELLNSKLLLSTKCNSLSTFMFKTEYILFISIMSADSVDDK